MDILKTAGSAVFAACLPGLIASCRNERVDAKEQELRELNSIVVAIASGLDSIARQEDVLLTSKSKDGVLLSKQQILENLKYFEEMLTRQRKQIQQLEDSLGHSGSESAGKLRAIVEFLNAQLAEKDATIQSLKRDLGNKNKSISELRASLASMRTNVERTEQKNKVLTSALSTQDKIINECYIKIGTRKELQKAGLLKGGFLSKKRVDYANVGKDNFNAVDIRKFREIVLNSDNPRILTQMPNNGSFHFEYNGDGTCTLRITDPTLFWSVSNFLIIQL